MNKFLTDLQESDIHRFFSVEQANAMIPLVRVIVEDMVAVANQLVDRQNRLDAIGSASLQRADLYADELQQIEKSKDNDKYRLQELMEELLELGVQPQEPVKGIVSFPTQVNDEISFLIWKPGDPSVTCYEQLEQDLNSKISFESFCEQSEN